MRSYDVRKESERRNYFHNTHLPNNNDKFKFNTTAFKIKLRFKVNMISSYDITIHWYRS